MMKIFTLVALLVPQLVAKPTRSTLFFHAKTYTYQGVQMFTDTQFCFSDKEVRTLDKSERDPIEVEETVLEVIEVSEPRHTVFNTRNNQYRVYQNKVETKSFGTNFRKTFY